MNRRLWLVVVLVLLGLIARPARVHAQFANQIGSLAAINSISSVLGPQTLFPARDVTMYIVWSTGTTGGTVVVEAAHDPGYTGTWAPIGTIVWSGANRVDEFAVQGVHLALRVRVTATVTGGTALIATAYR
jgi:hypothetical protein